MVLELGSGPGVDAAYLAALHPDVVGIDLSPRMVEIARRRGPGVDFVVGSMLELPVADGSWAGVVALYSIVHLGPEDRVTAFHEFARALRPGGWLLLAFHVDSPDFATGQVNHLTEWFGARVELDGHFLAPDEVVTGVEAAGFDVTAQTLRQPVLGVEHPSRRCYLLARCR